MSNLINTEVKPFNATAFKNGDFIEVSEADLKGKWSVVFFYPRLFPIHDVNPGETGIPDPIRTSIEKIRDDGVYVLENGIFLFMYIGLAVDPVWVRDISWLC